MAISPSDVLVIGAGVSGLTTAVCLAEAGLDVRVHTEEPPLRTTSAAAGAVWGPYLAHHERIDRWSRETLAVLVELAGTPDTGIRMVTGVEAARTTVTPPRVATAVGDFTPCAPGDLPTGFVTGWRYTAPVIDMPVYLEYLSRRLRRAGGEVVIGTVTSLADACRSAGTVVNCAGLGARDLVPDAAVTPVRGQLVVVDNPGVDWFFAEYAEQVCDLTYFLPHEDHVVLGGSAERGRSDLVPDPATSDAILRRCVAVEPRLRYARVRTHRVGLRPARSQVRVEWSDPGPGHRVVHNYGHGGAGVTLSWGCAREVLTMVTGVSR